MHCKTNIAIHINIHTCIDMHIIEQLVTYAHCSAYTYISERSLFLQFAYFLPLLKSPHLISTISK